MAPPTAALLARKLRRSISKSEVASMIFVIVASLPQQFRSPADRLADAQVGPAATDIGHVGVDFGVGRLLTFLEQIDRGHDLPRLTISALGNVELDPRELDRMAPIGRQALDGRNRPPHR